MELQNNGGLEGRALKLRRHVVGKLEGKADRTEVRPQFEQPVRLCLGILILEFLHSRLEKLVLLELKVSLILIIFSNLLPEFFRHNTHFHLIQRQEGAEAFFGAGEGALHALVFAVDLFVEAVGFFDVAEHDVAVVEALFAEAFLHKLQIPQLLRITCLQLRKQPLVQHQLIHFDKSILTAVDIDHGRNNVVGFAACRDGF